MSGWSHSRRFLRVLVMPTYPQKLTVAGGRARACLYHIAAASPGEPPRASITNEIAALFGSIFLGQIVDSDRGRDSGDFCAKPYALRDEMHPQEWQRYDAYDRKCQ